MKRRKFLVNLAGLTAFGTMSDLFSVSAYAQNRITPKNVIIRTSWSMDELGARIYLPAAFKMIQRNIPGAVLYFWPFREDEVVMDKIKLNITRFNLLTGDLDNRENPGELEDALKKADMVFHFGGTVVSAENNKPESSLLYSRRLFDFCAENKIPYILHSLKIADVNKLNDRVKDIINNASSVYSSYATDNKTLDRAGISNKDYEFSPDAGFYFDLNEEISANQYLRETNLAGKQFLVVSLRRSNLLGQNLELDKHLLKFAGLIKSWYSKTGNPVLIITGDTNDIDFIQNNLIDNAEENLRNHILMLKNMTNPSTILSILDKARICTGNDPYTLMMTVSSKVPVLFTRTTETDRSHEILLNTGLEENIINLSSSQTDDLSVKILSMNNKYVDELVEISKVSKILIQSEKKLFKTIDKTLGIKLINNQRNRPSRRYPHHRR